VKTASAAPGPSRAIAFSAPCSRSAVPIRSMSRSEHMGCWLVRQRLSENGRTLNTWTYSLQSIIIGGRWLPSIQSTRSSLRARSPGSVKSTLRSERSTACCRSVGQGSCSVTGSATCCEGHISGKRNLQRMRMGPTLQGWMWVVRIGPSLTMSPSQQGEERAW
jgi:hypothetical protein